MYKIKNIKQDYMKILSSEEALNKFCEENNLDKSTLKRTCKELRSQYKTPRSQHKGFTLELYTVITPTEGVGRVGGYGQQEPSKKNMTLRNDVLTVEDLLNLDNPTGVTEEDLLEIYNLSEDEWEVSDYQISIWQQTSDNPTGKKNLYAVKAKFKRIQESNKLNIDKIVEEINSIKELITPAPNIPAPNGFSNEDTLILNITDLHLNKLVEGESEIQYDSNVAVTRYYSAINDIVNRDTSKKVILVIGEDFFNIDNLQKTTTRGTPQSTHMNFYSMYKLGFQVTRELIAQLGSKYENVEVVSVLGNHDTLSTYCLVVTLEAYFRNQTNILFDSTYKLRKYKRLGNALIGFGHLNNETKQQKPFLMSTEATKDFGDTKYRYFLSGHLHTLGVSELGGVQYWTLPTLSESGDWENSKGFIGNLKSALGFVISPDKGLRTIYAYNE